MIDILIDIIREKGRSPGGKPAQNILLQSFGRIEARLSELWDPRQESRTLLLWLFVVRAVVVPAQPLDPCLQGGMDHWRGGARQPRCAMCCSPLRPGSLGLVQSPVDFGRSSAHTFKTEAAPSQSARSCAWDDVLPPAVPPDVLWCLLCRCRL